MTEQRAGENKKSFWALIITQFFGAFNDNFFKIGVALLVTAWVSDETVRNNWVSLSNLMFVMPFLIFSLAAGRIADRVSKTYVIIGAKVFELLVVAIAITGIYLKNIPLLMIGLCFLALQSAFFAPAKYGLLPELLKDAELSQANGLLNFFTILAILGGTVGGTWLISRPGWVVILMGGASILGLMSSLLIDKVPAANPSQPLQWNPIKDFKENWRQIAGITALRRSLVAVSYFWFMGAVFILNTVIYVKDMLGASDQMAGALLFANGVGIGVGSLLAGKLSKDRVELGLVPVGAILLSAATLDLAFAYSSLGRVIFDCVLLGFGSGIFLIPLNTLIQSKSPAESKGRVLATANFISFVAILMATPFFWLFTNGVKVGAANLFLALGILSLMATVAICITIPQSLIRLVLYLLTNLVYKIQIRGRENIPVHGPALIVSNHVSMVDPFLISASISRLIRFIMHKSFYDKPIINPFVRLMEAIPIDANDPPKEIMRSLLAARQKLKEGHLVCIFSEGGISRQGAALLGFQRGTETILKGLDVPVIPVHLEGVWGSIFSFEGGKFIWKWPRQIPYPVTITFGQPLIKPSLDEIRQAVLDLGSVAFPLHHPKEFGLFSAFIRKSKLNLKRPAATDSTGMSMTAHELLVGSKLAGDKFEKLFSLKKNSHVGLLLPPSVGALTANLAIASKGAVPINLNYTLTKEDVDEICAQADIDAIITSRKVLDKLGWTPAKKIILLEDVVGSFGKAEKIFLYLKIKLLPIKVIEKFLFPRISSHLDELATLMFTSGSTGQPKGVMLTQGNILSNTQSLSMIMHLNETDAILGILPFFHSFGFMAALWFPLISGFKAVYHTNPLDSKTIGVLCQKEKVSFLIGTPTFLSAYVRRIPKENFEHLRFAVAGAEKLRPELAQAWEEKFALPIMEGYGCTELSPVVALNLPDITHGDVYQVGRKIGKIGRPIPGVSIKTVNPDTMAQVKPGEPGLLLVKGPNVMKGYWKQPEKTKEVIQDGWYNTGDIARIDEDGFIEITDRLSRFSKIGGEMVPHILIEQKLHELAGEVDRKFVVSSTKDDKKGEALVVLFSQYDNSIEDLWKKLNGSGLPNLWIPAKDHFYQVESFPLLGSGKLDMQGVKAVVARKVQTEGS